MKTVVIVQARVGSTRLPGKVLLPLAGRPLLERMMERLKAAQVSCTPLVATTSLPEDEPIRTLCKSMGLQCYSGHPTDLLDRHFHAARRAKADIVVKIPSDCPLIDPAIIDRVVNFYIDRHRNFDFVSNLHPATYPDGNDVEVMPFAMLEEAWRKATKEYEREHTTPFIWERPEQYRVGNVAWESGRDCSMTHRWTVDYAEDYLLVKAVYESFQRKNRLQFALWEIVRFLEDHPEIAALNARYLGVNWYRHHAHELRTIAPHQYREAG